MDLTRRNLLIGTAAGIAGGLAVAHRTVEAAPNLSLKLMFQGFGTLVVDPTAKESAKAAATSKKVYMLALTGVTTTRHYTRLRIKNKFLKFAPAPEKPETFVEWNLRDYDVTVLGDVDAGPVKVANEPPVACPALGSPERDSVEMLGNLARLGGSGKGRVAPEVLGDNPPGVVSARVTLSAGSVKAVGAMGGYEDRTWKMRYPNGMPVSNGDPHVISESVVHSAQLLSWGGIKLEPFPGAAVPAVPLIELAAPSRDADVEVWVTNHAGKEEEVVNPEPVKHFSAYYDVLLLNDQPGQRAIPHPVGECPKAKKTAFGGKTGFCPGALAFTE
jgi:hypothetical protein